MIKARFFFRVLALILCPVELCYSQFSEIVIPGLPGVLSGSSAWGDYDNDGRMDFLISGHATDSGMPILQLWRNTDIGFSNVTMAAAPGLPGAFDGSIAWGDFDNDGRLDFLITGLTNSLSPFSISQVWRNTGGAFTNFPIPGLPGIAQSSVAWNDFDGDGRLDFLITGSTNGSFSGAISQLWRNTGDSFTNTPVPALVGVYFGSAAWGDFDNDGRPDFLITGLTNEAVTSSLSQLWRNTENGFTNVPVPGLRGVFVSSVAWGDYDNDSWLDFILEGFAPGGFITEIWKNTGHGFVKQPVPGLAVADGSLAWADFSADGMLDFLITGLAGGGDSITQIWENNGNGFTNRLVSGFSGNFDNSVACADFDNDGRVDFLIAGQPGPNLLSQLWRNVGPSTNHPPGTPTNLSATVTGKNAILSWDRSMDDETSASGLSYNVRIGTAPGAFNILSPPALSNGVLLVPQMGAVRTGSATFRSLQPGLIYYWSVQAVDTSFAGSSFATEQQFIIPPQLNKPTLLANAEVTFQFTNRTGLNFDIVVADSPDLPAAQWINLGAPMTLDQGIFEFTGVTGPNPRFYLLRQR
jgi:hypothetical protein